LTLNRQNFDFSIGITAFAPGVQEEVDLYFSASAHYLLGGAGIRQGGLNL
jgi:hypothetical protein